MVEKLKTPAKIFQSEVLDEKYLTNDVKYLKLKVPDDFTFKPGQYLSLSFHEKEKKFRRPYSIVKSPKRGGFAEFGVKLVDKGKAPEFIRDLEKGDKIELFGPIGRFLINKNSEKKDLVFISVGTGITTLFSMINSLLEKEFKNKIVLLKGFKHEDNILYEEEFSKLADNHRNFKFYNILSQPKNKNFENKGRVYDFLDKFISKDFKGDFYICGLKIMIESVKDKLKDLGVKEERIFFEKYD